ncbi:uncharacterized metal-binding protein YceD (DUF177 family) [Rhodobacteraceae bacterium MBR-64]|jgi:uncharacterized metal-binding protein YceD (DUF177 family)
MDETAPLPFSNPIRTADLVARRPLRFSHVPDAAALGAIAAFVGVDAVRKLRFAGELRPEGRRDWVLDATLGATVVQACVVTLAPVTSRIDVPVIRRFVAEPPPQATAVPEVEIPEDDTVEPLGAIIDTGAVMVEALALALPLYPRAEGAELGDLTVAPPGAEPIARAANPFAALSALRDRTPGED